MGLTARRLLVLMGELLQRLWHALGQDTKLAENSIEIADVLPARRPRCAAT